MESYSWHRTPYTLTTDPDQVQTEVVLRMLDATYWAGSRPHARTLAALRSSICFSLLHAPLESSPPAQVGFARVVTDGGTVAYLSDFVLLEEHRRQGLGAWIMDSMLGMPELRGLAFFLATKDAQPFYSRFGFGDHPFSLMYRAGATGSS